MVRARGGRSQVSIIRQAHTTIIIVRQVRERPTSKYYTEDVDGGLLGNIGYKSTMSDEAAKMNSAWSEEVDQRDRECHWGKREGGSSDDEEYDGREWDIRPDVGLTPRRGIRLV